MNDLILSVSNDDRPGYLRIAEGLRAAIHAGRVKPGEKLPSSRQLADMLGVHRHTVIAAMDELVAEGWLEASERRAHRVVPVLPSEFFKASAGKPSCFSRKLKWQFARDTGKFPCVLADDRQYKHIFQSGTPDLRLFPYDEFRACVADALRRAPARHGGYGSVAGHPEFIHQLADYLRRVRAIDGRKIIVTHGAQEGIFLAAQLLVKPGDKVAVESPGYGAAWDAFRAAGGVPVPLRVDAQGADPEALEELIGKHRLRLIYLTPHHQYPTTVTLPTARRLRIYELASRHQIPIIEDDYDHEFHFRSQPIAPMASSDACELVIYTSTLSKVVFPSARIGFLAVPEVIYKPLLDLRTIITRQNNTFMQDAVARWMQSGGFERHLRRMRRIYQERRDVLVEELEKAKTSGLPLSWTPPDGGMALWLDSGVDSDAVAAEAAALGVATAGESVYHLGQAPSNTHLRMTYANQNAEELRAGIGLLMRAVEKVHRDSRRPRRLAG